MIVWETAGLSRLLQSFPSPRLVRSSDEGPGEILWLLLEVPGARLSSGVPEEIGDILEGGENAGSEARHAPGVAGSSCRSTPPFLLGAGPVADFPQGFECPLCDGLVPWGFRLETSDYPRQGGEACVSRGPVEGSGALNSVSMRLIDFGRVGHATRADVSFHDPEEGAPQYLLINDPVGVIQHWSVALRSPAFGQCSRHGGGQVVENVFAEVAEGTPPLRISTSCRSHSWSSAHFTAMVEGEVISTVVSRAHLVPLSKSSVNLPVSAGLG